MSRYIVSVREVYRVPVEVEADTEDEAVGRVHDMMENSDDAYEGVVPEYEYTMEPTEWFVAKIPEYI